MAGEGRGMKQGHFPRRSQETQEAASTLFRRRQERRLAGRGHVVMLLVRPGRWGKGGWVWTHFQKLEARKLEHCLQHARTNVSRKLVLPCSARAISRGETNKNMNNRTEQKPAQKGSNTTPPPGNPANPADFDRNIVSICVRVTPRQSDRWHVGGSCRS